MIMPNLFKGGVPRPAPPVERRRWSRRGQKPSRPDMVWLEGGSFTMGSDHHYPEEGPAHRETVGSFWIDRNPVTNQAFAEFVEATGYVTLAERARDPAARPGLPPPQELVRRE